MAIEGMQIQLTTEQVAEYMDACIAHHTARATFYALQAEALRSERDNRSSSDPFYALDSRKVSHHQKAVRFAFLRAHLVPNEIYRLREHEAMELMVPEEDA